MGIRMGIGAAVALVVGIFLGKLASGFGGPEIVESKAGPSPVEEGGISVENAFLKQVDAAGPSDFATLVEELHDFDGGLQKALAKRELIRKWIKTDPDGWARHVFGLLAIGEGHGDFTHLLPAWASVDPEGLFSYALSATDEFERRYSFDSLNERFPERILQFLESNPEEVQLNESNISFCIAKLAETDPGTAAKYFNTHAKELKLDAANEVSPHWGYQEVPLPDLVARPWVEQDPAAALSWAASAEQSADRKSRLASVIGEWVKIDPAAAGEAFLAQDSPPDELLKSILQKLSKEDPVTAIRWADEFGGGEEIGWTVVSLFSQVTDPDEMLQLVGNLQTEKLRRGIPGEILTKWRSRDLAAGFELIRRHADSKEQQGEWLVKLAEGVGTYQFDEAMRVSEREIRSPADRAEFHRQLIIELAGKKPHRAWREAEQTGDDSLFAEVTRRVLEDMSSYDRHVLNSQVAEVIDELPPDLSAERGCYTLVNRWYEENREAAVEGVLGMSHPLNREIAIKELARRMANENEQETLRLAEQVPDSREKDIVIGELITYRKKEQPEKMFQLATGLGSEDRFRHLSGSLKVLARRDSLAAKQVLAGASGLTDRERERLRVLIY